MSHRQSSVVLAAAALAGAALLPATVGASEGDPLILPRSTAAAVTADLDGDGAREVVRIAEPERGAVSEAVDVVVEAWSVRGSAWSVSGSVPLTRPTADGRGNVPVDLATDAYALLTWHDGNRDRALVVTGAGPDRRIGSTSTVCCIVIAAVEATQAGIRLAALDLGGFDGFAVSVSAVDMDADGVDELVLSGPDTPEVDAHVTVLRWDGTAFAAERVAIGGGELAAHPTIVGDTDDIPGDEAVYGPTADGSLVRVGIGFDGALFVERAGFGPPIGVYPWFIGAGDGRLFARLPSTLSAWRWPRGATPELVGRVGIPDSSLADVVLAGGHAVVVQTTDPYRAGAHAAVRVHRSDLGTRTDADASPAHQALVGVSSEALHALARASFSLQPFIGEVPGGLPDGRAAFASLGNLITLDESGRVGVERIGALTGARPLGLAGRDGEWMAMSDGAFGHGGAYQVLFVSGGLFGGELAIVPTATVFDAETTGGYAVATDGLVPLGGEDGPGPWASGPDGFTVSVDIPAGATAAAFVDDSVVLEVASAGEPLETTLGPERADGANQEYRASVVVVTADGHVHVQTWDVVAMREPPKLTVTAATRTGSLQASVTGEASPHATVVVDGSPVPVASDGAFAADVAAALWPRDVRVVARDAVGNETVVQLSVIGGFDYRGLPWAVIVATVTVLCGAWLFLRTPHAMREAAVRSDDGDPGLEEMDSEVALRDRP